VAVIQYYGTGRRKSSTARVFLRPGSGQITINAKPIADAVNIESLRLQVRSPLVLTETLDKFDVVATTSGGGISGMAGALPVQRGAARPPQEGRPVDA
jgi:small subunit ribosomal protein S9